MKTIAEIAAELAGYDPQALSAPAVNDFLERLVEPVQGVETVGILDALGRVLAGDIVSPISVPPHDNSAMDGFAFDGAQLQGQPLTLDPLTVPDDNGFLELLPKERNLPKEIASEVPKLY